MDSAALLDLLGNENRRRILRLLSHKSCYVTEISDYLGVSPKAVIGHLRKLEAAGLVESRTDDRRRKYFDISRNLRLEVNVSRHGFGMKSAYPASRSLDITTCRHLSLDITDDERGDDLVELAKEFHRLDELESELSMAQRWVQGRLTDVMDEISDTLDEPGESRIYAAILAAIGDGATTGKIAQQVDAPASVVEDRLETMNERGIVTQTGERWQIAD